VNDIRLVNVTKEFGALKALDDVSFTIPKSSVTVLLGPSGCGKTTMMRIIAGLEVATRGEVFFDDQEATKVPTRRRNIGMVFQYPVIYKGTSVRRNLELPLLSQKLDQKVINDRVEEIAEILGITQHLKAQVDTLDNGTRQKIAVGREVVRQTGIILFDEPITNIDITAKLELKRSLKELFTRLNQTIVYVTHDQTEAMTLADQIALMKDGKILQCASPAEIYEKPNTEFAGWFLGSPGMNFVSSEFITIKGNSVSSALFSQTLELGAKAGYVKTIGVRAESIQASPVESPGSVLAQITGKSLGTGGQYLLDLSVGNLTVKARVPHVLGRDLRDQVWTKVDNSNIICFDESGGAL
jgi:ABC-type sugar transport system ATPase subunit